MLSDCTALHTESPFFGQKRSASFLLTSSCLCTLGLDARMPVRCDDSMQMMTDAAVKVQACGSAAHELAYLIDRHLCRPFKQDEALL